MTPRFGLGTDIHAPHNHGAIGVRQAERTAVRMAKLRYLSVLTGLVLFGGSALADSFEVAEKGFMSSVDWWAREMRKELTRTDRTPEDKLKYAQTVNLELKLLVDGSSCSDQAQAQNKLEPYIHKKFSELSDLGPITHAVNLNCKLADPKLPGKLDLTLLISKVPVSVADSKANEKAYGDAEEYNKMMVDKWATDTRNGLNNRATTVDYKLKNIKGSGAEFLSNIMKPCRDDAQARKLEAYIHQKFHEFSNIADITHGVNMSCSPEHTLRATLWISAIKLKS
jgi:hypothetical protein